LATEVNAVQVINLRFEFPHPPTFPFSPLLTCEFWLAAGNDVCPAMRLDSIDYVFARSGFRLSKALTKSKPAAKVLMWSNGDEAKAHFDSVVLGAPDVHTSKPQQQQQQGSRKEEQQRMSSECTRASSIVRTLQARVKDYSFLVCGIHPSLLKFIRGTLSSSSSSSPSMQSTKGGEDGSGREG